MGLRSGIRGALAAATLCLCGTAQAQVPDPFARQLAAQLAHAETMPEHQGFSRVAGPFAGGLPERLNRRFQVTLRSGQDYELLGVCDDRCHDLEVRLYDQDERLVTQSDIADVSNGVAVLHTRPAVTGLYTVDVVLYHCTGEAPCFFAFNVYGR